MGSRVKNDFEQLIDVIDWQVFYNYPENIDTFLSPLEYPAY